AGAWIRRRASRVRAGRRTGGADRSRASGVGARSGGPEGFLERVRRIPPRRRMVGQSHSDTTGDHRNATVSPIARMCLAPAVTRYCYKPEIVQALWAHGVHPKETTPPELVHDFVSDLYRYELRKLRDRLVRREIPKIG